MPKKTRRLWLNVTVENVISVSRRKFIETLIESIEREDYMLPKSWQVTLHWGNNPAKGADRSGPWTQEMRKSASSGDGFDKAVIAWLERKLQ